MLREMGFTPKLAYSPGLFRFTKTSKNPRVFVGVYQKVPKTRVFFLGFSRRDWFSRLAKTRKQKKHVKIG